GQLDVSEGRDPRPLYNLAISAFDRAIAREPSYLAFANRARTHNRLAEYERSIGIDPTASLNHAIADGEKVVTFNDSVASRVNLAATYRAAADHARFIDRDPSSSYARAEELLHEALRADAKYGPAWWMLADLQARRAGSLNDLRRDPTRVIADGQAALARAMG